MPTLVVLKDMPGCSGTSWCIRTIYNFLPPCPVCSGSLRGVFLGSSDDYQLPSISSAMFVPPIPAVDRFRRFLFGDLNLLGKRRGQKQFPFRYRVGSPSLSVIVGTPLQIAISVTPLHIAI